MDISLATPQYPQPALCVSFILSRHKMAAAFKVVYWIQGIQCEASKKLPPGEAPTIYFEEMFFSGIMPVLHWPEPYPTAILTASKAEEAST